MSLEGHVPGEPPAYQDMRLSAAARAADLVSRMTLEEKVAQMQHEAAEIPRLGVPRYSWWNECLHGVARAGVATVFPQAIGLAAMWNEPLLHRIAMAISDEARAKHHEALRRNEREIYKGLTFWSPNINIFRDPRWGRGHETYGEDPFLTARLGVAFVKGLQGDDPKYLKVAATPKHFAVHSGPELDRHRFDARVSEKDLRETYLPAFKACVQEGGAASVMGAYNRTNGEPCCASPTLLQKILREEWGFDGYVVSDCGAICDIHKHHKLTDRPAESAAMAVRAGCDLNCGEAYPSLTLAVEEGLIEEAQIDRAVIRLMTARFRLGMFDPPEQVPYAQIPYEVNDCEAHRTLSLQAACESIVLLKNANRLLPLSQNVKSVAVIGPNADTLDVLLGNYYGTPSRHVTPLQGIRAKLGPHTRVFYAKGCGVADRSTAGFDEAVAAARQAEVAILCLGLSPEIEGEENDVAASDGGGDRLHLNLPGVQQQLLEAVCATGTPVVLVLLSGSPLAITWADAHVPAIVEAWYPGEEGGTAIADVLFGDFNPAGRLPITFPRGLDQVPAFADYRMEGRTHRYLREEPLYRFGHGLSYTRFVYRNLELGAGQIKVGQELTVRIEVENAGSIAGDEVVQLYVRDVEASVPVPLQELRGFARVQLGPGERRQVTFVLKPEQLALYDLQGRQVLEPGEFEILVGGCSPAGTASGRSIPGGFSARFTVVVAG